MTAEFEDYSKHCTKWEKILMELKIIHISGQQNYMGVVPGSQLPHPDID